MVGFGVKRSMGILLLSLALFGPGCNLDFNVEDFPFLGDLPPGCEDRDGDGFGYGAECPEDVPLDCLDEDSEAGRATFPGATEVCDGLDNDCDDATDEDDNGDPLSRACYEGPDNVVGTGICTAGTEVCLQGSYGECRDQVVPRQLEACNGLDDDCDGETDEGNPGGAQACSTELPGRGEAGQTQGAEGGEIVCVQTFEAQDEECNGLDDDCDGETDEGEDGQELELTCYNGPDGTEGVGLCQAGTRVCRNAEFSDCDDVRPTPELCNGQDDDCDGEIDEGNPGAGVACDADAPGRCRPGTTVCLRGTVVCQSNLERIDETCNGQDDDCDGMTDEGPGGFPLQTDCYGGPQGRGGVGVCDLGVSVCENGTFGECVGDVLPGAEVCDGLDNDCDGNTDEDSLGRPLAQSCYEGPDGTAGVGICRAGQEVCTNGEFGECQGQRTPDALEVCNGSDDDCDGETDEGDNDQPLQESCYEGPDGTVNVGLCVPGRKTCIQGTFGDCIGDVTPNPELCDNQDNDCDGSTDEGPEGSPLTELCYDFDQATAGVGQCQVGERTCTEGGFGECDGQVGPDPESCDLVDNDCNGVVDDGLDNIAPCGDCGIEQCIDGTVECINPDFNVCGTCVNLDDAPGSSCGAQCGTFACAPNDQQAACRDRICIGVSTTIRLYNYVTNTDSIGASISGNDYPGGLFYGLVTPYIQTIAGSYGLRFYYPPTAESDLENRLYDDRMNLAFGKEYTMFLLGSFLGEPQVSWSHLVVEDDNTAVPDMVKLRFVHAHSAVPDNVDVYLDGDPIFVDVNPRSVTDYTILSPLGRTITVREAGADRILYEKTFTNIVPNTEGIPGGEVITLIYHLSDPFDTDNQDLRIERDLSTQIINLF